MTRAFQASDIRPGLVFLDKSTRNPDTRHDLTILRQDGVEDKQGVEDARPDRVHLGARGEVAVFVLKVDRQQPQWLLSCSKPGCNKTRSDGLWKYSSATVVSMLSYSAPHCGWYLEDWVPDDEEQLP